MSGRIIEDRIGDELDISPRMVRFYALRMISELSKGRQIKNPDQRKIFNASSKKNMDLVFNE